MDGDRFDHVVRVLLGGASRRSLLRRLSLAPAFARLAAYLADDEVSEAKNKKNKRKKRKNNKKKKCKSQAQVCAGKCGSVTYKCNKRKKTADCGACACDPPCNECSICDEETRTCEGDPGKVGEACGQTGQVCQDGGGCACDDTSCPDCADCQDGACTTPCGGDGCCDGGACQDGMSDTACGAGGEACAVCTGDEVCIDGACVVQECDVCETDCPFTSVQDAIDDPATQDGDTIAICAGTFGGNISINKNVTIVGAGQGGNPDSSTILQGDGTAPVVTIPGASVTLRRLRITGGGNPSGNGGGIQNQNQNDDTLTLVNVTVTNNAAMQGGGVFNGAATQLTMLRCTISDNDAEFGGGIYLDPSSALEISDSDVTGNIVTQQGSGIYNFGATLTLTATEVSDNSAVEDGGGIFNDEGTVDIDAASVITDNSAGGAGGGILNQGTITCEDAVVTDNMAGDPAQPSDCIEDSGGSGCDACNEAP